MDISENPCTQSDVCFLWSQATESESHGLGFSVINMSSVLKVESKEPRTKAVLNKVHLIIKLLKCKQQKTYLKKSEV